MELEELRSEIAAIVDPEHQPEFSATTTPIST